MLPLSPYLKDAFEKFEQDFQGSNLPEGKYIKPSASPAKWHKVGYPCFEDRMQELNSDFAKICISPKLSGAPMGKVPLQVLKELEHQARQNFCSINFAATFWKSARAILSRLLRKSKAKFKRVPILKKQPGVAMRMPVTTLRFLIRGFLFNREL